MTAQRIKKLTVEEYVELEQSTNTKYEYHDGEVFALAGGSFNHSVLCSEIHLQLGTLLAKNGDNCFAFTSEMKLNIKKYNEYFYPDAMVVCGELVQSPQFKDAISNPVLIVEVLSEGTAEYDRGEKFHKYRNIKTFQEYVLIAQDKPVVEIFYRKKNANSWQIDRYVGLETSFQLQSISIEILMKALYDKIKFEEK